MGINHIIGQHMIIGLSGLVPTADEKKFIIENNIAGVVLFSRNVDNPKQVYDLCTEIHELRADMPDRAPLFIGIDMEGGRVHRLKPPFTQWPSLQKLGKLDNATASFQFAQKMGEELRAVGINLNFAPCLDIFTNPKNTVIGDRSLSSDPEMVAKHASALVRGYIKAGLMSCVKHFPGHGNTLVDSHEDLPTEDVGRERLDSCELIPFKKAFRSRAEMVMTSHIIFNQIDAEWPVTLSSVFLKKILRQEFRYRGLIITDDLDMKALTKHYSKEQIPVRALQAGADILLYCNEPESPQIAIDAITNAVAQDLIKKSELELGWKIILDTKKDFFSEFSMPTLKVASSIVGNIEHQALAKAIFEGRLPAGILPERA